MAHSLICYAYKKANGKWGIGWGTGIDTSKEPVDKLLGEWDEKVDAEKAAKFQMKAFEVVAW